MAAKKKIRGRPGLEAKHAVSLTQSMLPRVCRPQEIDEAARRRLVKRLYIPLPDTTARRQIVTNLMREQPFSLSEEEIGSVCEQSEGVQWHCHESGKSFRLGHWNFYIP